MDSVDKESVETIIQMEREAEIKKKIDEWRDSSEYLRLNKNMRARIEDCMHEKQDSKTVIFLERIIDLQEKRWPKEEARIPFYERAFIKYKQRQEKLLEQNSEIHMW